MILIDFNQIMISQLMMQLKDYTNAEIDEGMLRHMCLNKIRVLNVKFRKEYGPIIICAEGRYSWRRDFFPYYKANRRAGRDESELDWKVIYEAFDRIKAEMSECLGYKVIHNERAEADDIIGTICHNYGSFLNTGEKILILSTDKDFIQLHKYGNVKQYAPAQDKWVVHSDPEQYLVEHIYKGDAGDGVPNVMSAGNALVEKIRQKPVTKKRVELWSKGEELTPEIEKNIERNRTLIDLEQCPIDIQADIIKQYEAPIPPRKKSILSYFMENKLKLLTEHISDF